MPQKSPPAEKHPFFWRWIEVIAIVVGAALIWRAGRRVYEGDINAYPDLALGVIVMLFGGAAYVARFARRKR